MDRLGRNLLIRERQREGIELAKARGAYRGRRRSLSDDEVAEIRRRVEDGVPKAALARKFGVSREADRPRSGTAHDLFRCQAPALLAAFGCCGRGGGTALRGTHRCWTGTQERERKHGTTLGYCVPVNKTFSRISSPRTLAVIAFLATGLAFIVVGLVSPSRCTKTVTATPSVNVGGHPSTKRVTVCTPATLTDPPLAALGVVMLLFAVPALGLSEVAFAGVSIKKSVAQAAQAASQASGAAERATTAALALASAATASSTAHAQGNVLNVGDVFGGIRADLDSAEAGLAFTLGASGVVSAIIENVTGVVDASVLWLDRATDTLRPYTDGGAGGADARGPLGDVVRRAVSAIVTLNTPTELGLTRVTGTTRAMAVPARHPPHSAVGVLLLALAPPEADPSSTREAVDPAYTRPTALLIERLTAAGSRPSTIMSGGTP